MVRVAETAWKVVWLGERESVVVSSYEEWKVAMQSSPKGVDCYFGDLMSPTFGFPWIPDALEDERCTINVTKNDGIASMTLRLGKVYCTVASLSRWSSNWMDLDIVALLQSIKNVCDVAGVGIYPSPSALGFAMQAKLWQGSPVTRPPDGCRNALLSNLIGGRVEYSTNVDKYSTVIELDLRSAYASCCGGLPVGTTIHIPASESHGGDWLCDRYPAWFAECTVEILSPLHFGCFGVRDEKGRWKFPTQPGTYHCWLWREEWLDVLAAGCGVTVGRAYCWERTSDNLIPWVETTDELRNSFECEGLLLEASLTKRCIVAAIGRFGIAPEDRVLVPESRSTLNDVPVTYKDVRAPISSWYVRVTPNRESAAPVHWHSFILMQCRRKLYYRAVEELEDGNELIAANFDALYLAKESVRPVGRGIGQWKSRKLTNVSMPYARAVVSREKLTLPGVTGERRNLYVSTSAGTAKVVRSSSAHRALAGSANRTVSGP